MLLILFWFYTIIVSARFPILLSFEGKGSVTKIVFYVLWSTVKEIGLSLSKNIPSHVVFPFGSTEIFLSTKTTRIFLFSSSLIGAI